MLADCTPDGNLLRFLARDQAQDVCFELTGTEGYLSLELTSVHGVKTNDYSNTHLEMTAATDHVEYDVPAGTWKGIGESVDGRDHTLIEIRTTK
ncbi:hypothetical protein [Streptomyces laurentii]|uniref:hypothetical protein n=1 Tax=Streptomyces laurentii TaxID=39478 RepID=UPI003691177B